MAANSNVSVGPWPNSEDDYELRDVIGTFYVEQFFKEFFSDVAYYFISVTRIFI